VKTQTGNKHFRLLTRSFLFSWEFAKIPVATIAAMISGDIIFAVYFALLFGWQPNLFLWLAGYQNLILALVGLILMVRDFRRPVHTIDDVYDLVEFLKEKGL